MKKISVLLIALILVLTACNYNESPIESSSDGSNDSLIDSSSSIAIISSENNRNTLTDGVYTTYDKSKYEDISTPKIYYADFQKIEEKTFLALFSSKPTYSNETQQYITENECGWYTVPSEEVRYYTMSYYTTEGADCNSAGAKIFSNYSTTSDLDFMTRNEMQTDFINTTSEIFKTGIEISAYAISKDGYTDHILRFLNAERKEI